VPFPVPRAKIPIVVRQLAPDDDLSFLAEAPELDPELAQFRADERWLLTGDLPTPWVAVDPEGKVCLMTFLLTSRDNDAIQARWGAMLPVLQPDEVLLEGSYTPEKYRGMGILPEAGTRVVEQARDDGARYGMTFIADWNAASLRAGEKAGWIPFTKREESWFLFRRRIRFLPLTEQDRT
jgi:RimJ/RimL family protein N-acetyltransferase